ncbi:AAC(3) family N-acetyltransferase [Campylobacter cuniculorum]|uniref:Aminoglycoside N(3)-acetyltransferase n=2 Tax=Campylobacter cuniculorum TaxID=374106 RepID=A0A1W6BVW4_9BACT|nr:AAC(3) family N-acetyltransferase [Campylobacter cuniculorum]ARJ56246.1 aminoglycoside N3'-acetyltransferase [Campylobacter cuniculorum DSM 23162 = LMG 24588]QOR03736.1 aminoglycoside N(3)-acetyltransferase [Campylobacter cuniculorum]
MQVFLKHKDRSYTKDDFIGILRDLGIKKNDCICVHTEIFKLGIPLVSKEEFLRILLEGFLEVLGTQGTLIMPTFTYSFCKNQAYDKVHSKSTMGILTEYFRRQKGVLRTNDPIFSFALWGAKSKEFLSENQSCFGENCVYESLYKNNGKIVLFGTEHLGYTFTHFIEEQARVSYRYFKEFRGILIDEHGQKFEKSILYFVRHLDRNSTVSLEKQIKILKESHNFKSLEFGGAHLVLIRAKEYFEVCLKALKKDENALLLD